MSDIVAKQSKEANAAQNIKNPQIHWMIGFLFVVSFLGLFSVVPLRKVHILRFCIIQQSLIAEVRDTNNLMK